MAEASSKSPFSSYRSVLASSGVLYTRRPTREIPGELELHPKVLITPCDLGERLIADAHLMSCSMNAGKRKTERTPLMGTYDLDSQKDSGRATES